MFNTHDTNSPITEMDDKSPAPDSKNAKYYNFWKNKMEIPPEIAFPCHQYHRITKESKEEGKEGKKPAKKGKKDKDAGVSDEEK